MTGITAKKYDALFEKAGVRSPKQRAFCLEYFNTEFNGTEAIKRAGFVTKWPNRMANEYLNKPHIKHAIRLIAEERKEKITISDDYLTTKLQWAIERAEETGNLNAIIQAINLGFKKLGLYVEKTEISGKDGEAIKLEKVNEDVAAFTSAIAGLAKRSDDKDVSSSELLETKH